MISVGQMGRGLYSWLLGFFFVNESSWHSSSLLTRRRKICERRRVFAFFTVRKATRICSFLPEFLAEQLRRDVRRVAVSQGAGQEGDFPSLSVAFERNCTSEEQHTAVSKRRTMLIWQQVLFIPFSDLLHFHCPTMTFQQKSVKFLLYFN